MSSRWVVKLVTPASRGFLESLPPAMALHRMKYYTPNSMKGRAQYGARRRVTSIIVCWRAVKISRL